MVSWRGALCEDIWRPNIPKYFSTLNQRVHRIRVGKHGGRQPPIIAAFGWPRHICASRKDDGNQSVLGRRDRKTVDEIWVDATPKTGTEYLYDENALPTTRVVVMSDDESVSSSF